MLSKPWKIDADQGKDESCNDSMTLDQPVDVPLHLIYNSNSMFLTNKGFLGACIRAALSKRNHLLYLVNLNAADGQTHQIGDPNLKSQNSELIAGVCTCAAQIHAWTNVVLIISKEETDPKEEGHLAYGGGCGSFLMKAIIIMTIVTMIAMMTMMMMMVTMGLKPEVGTRQH